ncbi:MAG: hypothetical protein WCI11_09855 [Candidatus Methylumidiphilus sp.]
MKLSPQQTQANVTVTANVAGLGINVDGLDYTTPPRIPSLGRQGVSMASALTRPNCFSGKAGHNTDSTTGPMAADRLTALPRRTLTPLTQPISPDSINSLGQWIQRRMVIGDFVFLIAIR